MAEPTLSLVVPVYNERERVGEFFDELRAFVAARPTGSELIVVDDGSVDGTAELVESLVEQSSRSEVSVLRRAHQGKGAAVAAGIAASRAEVIAFCDIDLSTPLSELLRIVRLAARADVLAIGSRDVSGSVLVRPQGKTREALGRAYNRLLQATATPGIVDTQCGAKAARAQVWRQVLPYCHQVGFSWDAEVIAVALALQIDVQEVAIAWHHDDRSRVRVLHDGLAMLRETMRISRSAATARATLVADASLVETRADTSGEVFDAINATRLLGADRTHWWFRSKAAYVSTALRRTAPAGCADGPLLDIGGGSGGVSALLGWPPERIVLIEGSEALLRGARARLGLGGVQGSVSQIPAMDEGAAVVALLDVIEHLVDARTALVEAARVLRPDGRLIVNVPAHRWLWSAADVELGHHRRYTRRALRAELDEAGFEPILLTHVFSWLVAPVWLVRRRAAPGKAELGLDRHSPLIDLASLALTAIERRTIGHVSIPFGTSVLCVATKRKPSRRAPQTS